MEKPMSETKHEQAGMTIQVKHGGQVVIDPEKAEDQPALETTEEVGAIVEPLDSEHPVKMPATRPAKRRK